MKKLFLSIMLIAGAFVSSSCMREILSVEPSSKDLVRFSDGGFLAEVTTKTTAEYTLADLQSNGFHASATTGSAGSEVSAWNDVTFTRSGSTYIGNKYWPASDPSYHFYGSNMALTHTADGCTVSAANTTDVVCAYLASSTYKEENTLTFEHIFARVSRVDIVAESGYTISGITMSITPKTGGTYNLRTGAGQTDGTGWSGLTTGSATTIATAVGANNNDIYLVPGVYQVTCSWISTDANSVSVTHTNKVSSLSIVGGKTNNISVVLGGDLLLGVDLQDYCEYDYRDNLDYLTFYCDEAGTIGWQCSDASIARTIQYSKDFGATWIELTSTTSGATISVAAGDIVWFKGNNTAYSNGFNYNQFTLSNKAHVYGNVNSLTGNNTSVSQFCFCMLFSGCNNLYTYEHKKIILPATTLADYCYMGMFSGCTSLTAVSKLPATTLADYCYYSMFSGCSSLTAVSKLPATTLANSCYGGMFSGCTSLTTAPELPATTLANSCYSSMFSGCTSLTTAPELPATTLANSCYSSMFSGCTSLTTAPELSVTTLAESCYYSMFSGCTSLTAVSKLPATTLAESCYNSMFSGCTSLTTAPELPATTLSRECYALMFSGCTSLNYIKAMFTTTPSDDYTVNWVSGVADKGVFVKNPLASWDVVGNNGVPTGWYSKVDEEDFDVLEPLTIEARGNGNITWIANNADWTRAIEYSKDNGNTWTSITATLSSAAEPAVIPVATGDKVLLRGNNNAYGYSSSKYCYFSADVDYYLYGNMASLLGYGYRNRLERYCFYKLFQKNSHLYNHPTKKILLPSLQLADYCYASLFTQCSNLTEAPELPATNLAPYCYNAMFSTCPGLTSIPELPANTLADSCYENMFSGCTGLTSVPELHALELAAYCYGGMFMNCINLTSPPTLPATTLMNYSYYRMFEGCTGLTVAPQLPATTLGKYCYYNMFNGCRALTTAPELPATTLAEYCYWQMFMGCTALTTVPNLPAVDLTGAAYCYYCMFKNCTSLVTPPVISATVIVNDCYKEMFSGCSSLATAPALPVTFLKMNCYQRMFYNCTSLTTAPDLPATALYQGCYTEMFYGCSSLNYIRALFTTQPSTTFTQSWVSGVAANGTFVKNSNATWNRNDVQGVPYGWTIILE